MAGIDLQRIEGQGEARDVSPEMYTELVRGLDDVRHDHAGDIWDRRTWAENVRFCQWEGQSPDGRVREEYLNDAPFPFEGASDARVRLADFVLRVQVATLKQSVKRATVRIRGMEANDADVAGHLNTLASWLLNNRMSSAWRMHIERLAQWGLGDSPAVSLLHVYQDQKEVLRMRDFSLEDFIVFLDQAMGGEEGIIPETDEISALIFDKDRESEFVDLINLQFPQLKAKTIRRSLKELREEGSTRFPVVELERNEPRIEALRMWEDVFIPVTTQDPEDCRLVYVRRWMTLQQLEEKERMEGWDSDAIDVLTGRDDNGPGKAGDSYILEADSFGLQGIRESDGAVSREGEYEVITAYINGVNDDGVPGVFTVPFSGFVDTPLGQLQLLDYPHGGLPFVWYVREYVSKCLLDSRGVCELLQTDQDFIKHMRDLSADHAQVFTLPPYLHNMMSPDQDIRFSSLALIQVGPTGNLTPLPIPKTDDLPIKHMETVLESVFQYWGIGGADELIKRLLTQDMVDDFMDAIRQALQMLLQLAVEYMDEAELRSITGAGEEIEIGDLRTGMKKLRDIEIDFSSAVFDAEYIKELADVIQTALSFDTEQRTERGELTDWFYRQISPSLANKVVRSKDDADMSEVKDEQMNIALMESGVEPEMKEDGQNFALRLQVLNGWIQKREIALQQLGSDEHPLAGWDPVAREIFFARHEQLTNQVGQQENALIGRRMGQEVMTG